MTFRLEDIHELTNQMNEMLSFARYKSHIKKIRAFFTYIRRFVALEALDLYKERIIDFLDYKIEKWGHNVEYNQ